MFLHLQAKLRPMIKDQIKNVKVHKENMDLKRTINCMEHRVAQERETNRVMFKTLDGRIKDLAHGLEKQLELAGQSRGTAILNTSFTMGDAERIGKVLRERSNYNSAGEATPEKLHRGARNLPKGGHARVLYEPDTCSDNKGTQASDSK